MLQFFARHKPTIAQDLRLLTHWQLQNLRHKAPCNQGEVCMKRVGLFGARDAFEPAQNLITLHLDVFMRSTLHCDWPVVQSLTW